MIPECLTRSADLLAALNEAEEMKESILSHPEGGNLSAEIDFLEDQIADLMRQQSRNEKESQKIFSLLRKNNNSAFVAANLHYKCGYTWEKIAEILELNASETVKTRVYRALNRLYQNGLIK